MSDTIKAPDTNAAEPRKVRRLNHLLETREQLSAAAAVLEAHRLGDFKEVRRVQYATEFVIGTEFDGTYERLCGEWMTRDLQLMHDGLTKRSPECPVCNRSGAPDARLILAPRVA